MAVNDDANSPIGGVEVVSGFCFGAQTIWAAKKKVNCMAAGKEQI